MREADKITAIAAQTQRYMVCSNGSLDNSRVAADFSGHAPDCTQANPAWKARQILALARPRVDIFTDGACSGNPGPGGWGAILRFGAREKEISGGEARAGSAESPVRGHHLHRLPISHGRRDDVAQALEVKRLEDRR
jgi:hypothetical protein